MEFHQGAFCSTLSVDQIFEPPSDLSLSIAHYLRLGEQKGIPISQLINAYMNTLQSESVHQAACDFEGAHAYLLIGARLSIVEEFLYNA